MPDEETTRIQRMPMPSKGVTTSFRLRDPGTLVTRKVTLKPLELQELFGRLHNYIHAVGKLHDARDITAIQEVAVQACSALMRVRHHQFIEQGIGDNAFVPVPGGNPPTSEASANAAHDEQLTQWAIDNHHVSYAEVDDPKNPEIKAIAILPLAGTFGSHSLLLLWLADTIEEMSVLQLDMLQELARTITARSSALAQEERHRRLSSLFDNILESVPNAIIAIAGDDRVIAINANAEFLFGIKRIFVMDEPYETVFPPDMAFKFKELMAESVIGNTNVADAEIECKLEGGVSVNLGVSVTFLRDRTGKPQGHLFLCRDLSLSREVIKLRELDQLKSEFVNTVSHELKTPLTAILGGLEIIQDDVAQLPEDMREIIGVVGDGAKRLRNLIFDLLDVSRLESGRVNLQEEVTDIRNVIQEALRVQHPHEKHTLVVDVAKDVTPIMMDRGKMIQVVTNFVSNAIKYSPNGGTITIGAKINPQTRMLTVSVADQGLGIAERHLKKIWQKFYRVDASYTSEIEGTGLGLVIVKAIVELHGGTVWVESEVGKGSTFFLTIPLRKKEQG